MRLDIQRVSKTSRIEAAERPAVDAEPVAPTLEDGYAPLVHPPATLLTEIFGMGPALTRTARLEEGAAAWAAAGGW